ncbi:MAG: NADP-dependent oxidoreductase [Stackebrandtia sp.]
MSKAVAFSEYGDPDVLHLVDVEPPRPGPGQVRIRVKAAGVQPFDCLFRRGAVAKQVPANFPQQLGNEVSGLVDAVGEGVDDFSVGDAVLGWVTLAAYAEHAVVGVDQLVPKPRAMPWEAAGVVTASGQTAHTALRELGVGAGDTVLIHAAAGGVGSFAVQLALAWGAAVVGTASPRNHDYLRSLGAIPVAYGEGLADRVRALAPAIDASFDCVATEESLRTSVELVKELSRVGTVAFNPLHAELGVRRLTTERSIARLTELIGLYSEGKLRVEIAETFPLEQAAAAHRAIETGHVRGKIVLVP